MLILMIALLYHIIDQHHIGNLQQGYMQDQLHHPCLLLYSPMVQMGIEHVVSFV